MSINLKMYSQKALNFTLTNEEVQWPECDVCLTWVSCSAMWIAVCVCSVTAPVRIRDVPFANAIKMMSWGGRGRQRRIRERSEVSRCVSYLVLQELVHAAVVSDVSQQHLSSFNSNFISIHTWNTHTGEVTSVIAIWRLHSDSLSALSFTSFYTFWIRHVHF